MLLVIIKFLAVVYFVYGNEVEENIGSNGDAPVFSIEGKVTTPDESPKLKDRVPFIASNTKILLNGGEFLGLVREDGSFLMSGLPSNSYLLEVASVTHVFEPLRVDVNSKGKVRVRRAVLEATNSGPLPYPLRLKPRGQHRYFQQREQWRVTDFLFSPMVLMMVLPLLLIMVLPKMMNDPETRKEMEQLQVPKYDMPELSEALTSFFGGGSQNKPKHQGTKTAKKRQ